MVAILPPYVSTCPFVASTAASPCGVSAATPTYACPDMERSYAAPGLWPASANERDATACASSASSSQLDGISDGTTASRYC